MTNNFATLALAATEAEKALRAYCATYDVRDAKWDWYEHARLIGERDATESAFSEAATPSVVLALTAALDRARAEAEAYRRGWTPLLNTTTEYPKSGWYSRRPSGFGSQWECALDSLVSHLASLEKP